MGKRAMVFLAWGESYVASALEAVASSAVGEMPVFLITDETTEVGPLPGRVSLVRGDLGPGAKVRKSRMFALAPKTFDSLLFLDVDTRVIGDVSLGFDKAERHGIAMAQATHYSLADFRGFGRIMEAENVTPRGQLLYNSGVIFFDPRREDVRAVFELAAALAERHPDAPWGDQTYLTLAMEMLEFNPYTLSTAFNHRAFGELISGQLRIWHSYQPLPEGARDLESGWLHRFEGGRMVKALKIPD